MSNTKPEIYFSKNQTDFLCRIVFALILIDLIFSAFSNTLIHQLQSPVLKFAFVDPTFWTMHLLRIPGLISSSFYLSWFWDVALFGSCIGILFFPGKRWLIAIFIIFYFVYYIIFNSYGAHHTHSLVAVLIAPVPFLFSRRSFAFSWQALRYFLLFSYSSAFLWKFFRFSWLQADQGILIVKKNLTPYLYFNPHTFLADIYFWFLHNPAIVQAVYLSGFILEGFFIVGFFTKKFDKILFIISLLLPIGFWFMSDAFFFEMLILSIALVPLDIIHLSESKTIS